MIHCGYAQREQLNQEKKKKKKIKNKKTVNGLYLEAYVYILIKR